MKSLTYRRRALARVVNQDSVLPGRAVSIRCHPLAVAIVALLALLATGATARAESAWVFRIGVEPLALEPSSDTPYIGGYVDDAIAAYNAGSALYNRAHGYSAGSNLAVAPIDRSALGLHATLLTFAPGFEIGGDHVRFRAEGLLGVSDHVRALGIGLYPIDIALPLHSAAITPYIVAGGTLRWLDRSDTDGEVGGLATLRAAAGARIGRHAIVELGVGLVMLGGLYNSGQLDSIMSYDPRGSAPPPPPDRAVSGGMQTGMIDISVGFVL
jgi:hypothetical protein